MTPRPITRRIPIALLCLGAALPLAGCLHAGLPAFSLGAHAPAATPGAAATKPVCSAAVTADLPRPPDVPAGAKIPAAESAEVSAGLAIYLGWLKQYADWAKAGWARIAQAQQDCGAPPHG